MSLLTDSELRKEIELGLFKVEPYADELVQPASIDLRLGRRFLTFNADAVDAIDPSIRQIGLVGLEEHADNQPFILHPGQFVLGGTFEKITMPVDLAARIEGKSSLGRLGLMVHSTAGFIDPGFRGSITLELSNVNALPIKLWPGMLIAQLCVLRTTGSVSRPYGKPSLKSHYQDQGAPLASRSYVHFRHGLDKVDTGRFVEADYTDTPYDRRLSYPGFAAVPDPRPSTEDGA